MKTPSELAQESFQRYWDGDGSNSPDSFTREVTALLVQVIAEAKSEARQEMLAEAVRDCPYPEASSHLQWLWRIGESWPARVATIEELAQLRDVIAWLEARIAFLANETGYADDIKAARDEGYRRGKEDGLATGREEMVSYLERIENG